MSRPFLNRTTKEKIALFWSRVDKSPGHGPKGKCWKWIGAVDKDGYGLAPFKIKGERRVHRITWKLHKKGSIKSLQVCHHCDYTSCCRPSHLFRGTNTDNVRDMGKKERNGRAKVSHKEVKKIRKLYASGKFTQRQLGDMYGLNNTVVSDMVNCKTFAYVQ